MATNTTKNTGFGIFENKFKITFFGNEGVGGDGGC